MDLKKEVVSGVKWTGLANMISVLAQLGAFVFLARLLKPSDIGIMGMIMVVIGFSQIFTDFGISNAIIQKQNSTRDELSSLYWLSLALGVLITIIFLFCEPLVEAYYKQPQLSLPYNTISAIFIIEGAGQQFQTLLRKNLNFSLLSKIQVASNVISFIASLIFATTGFGVMSIVYAQIISKTFTTLSLFITSRTHWLPHFHFKIKDLSGYMNFGLNQMGSRVVNYISANIDYVFIGRFMGAEALGYYSLAYQMITFPLQRINPVVTQVVFPAFSKIQEDDEKIRSGYLKVLQILSLVVFPLLLGAGAMGNTFVLTIFGEKWLPATALLQIFALLGCLRVIINPCGTVYYAKGRADLDFKWNSVVMLVNTAVIWFTMQYSLEAICWGLLCAYILYFFLFYRELYRLVNLNLRDCLNSILPAAISGGLMVAGIIGINYILSLQFFTGWHIYIKMAILTVSAACVYILILYKYYINIIKYYINFIKLKEK